MTFNWANKKDLQDFSASWVSRRTCSLKQAARFLLSPALNCTISQTGLLCLPISWPLFEDSSLLLFMLNTNHFVSCSFPFMQANLKGFLLSVEFTSPLTWMASVWGCISVQILFFQGQWCMAWKWEFMNYKSAIPSGKMQDFLWSGNKR